MPNPTTVRLDKDTLELLDMLANWGERSRALVIKEAISQYLEREMKYIQAVQKGLEEARQGQMITKTDTLNLLALARQIRRESVRWTQSALRDANAIANYFSAANIPREGVNNVLCYLPALSRFINTPTRMGEPGKVPGTREYLDAENGCRLIYEATSTHIHILRILHDKVGFADKDDTLPSNHHPSN